MNDYRSIAQFGKINNISTDPLTYCLPDGLNSQFLHGATGKIFGKYNRHCAEFMSERCSDKWDDICEAASTNNNANYPDMSQKEVNCARLTQGEILVRDTAYKKYRMGAKNCAYQCEPFDPTVADSPLVCYETDTACSVGDSRTSICAVLNTQGKILEKGVCVADGSSATCLREYGITPAQAASLDKDPVMNKLIDDPYIAPLLLQRIYGTMKQRGTLALLRNTRLAALYRVNGYSI